MQLAARLPRARRLGRHLSRRLARYARPGWAFTDQAVVSAGNFVTIYLFARELPTGQFGVLMLARTGLLLLSSAQDALLAQPHNVLGAALPGPSYRRFTGAMVIAQLLWAFALLLVLGAAGAGLYALRFAESGRVLVALALASPPWLAQEFVRRVLYTRGASRAAALNDMLTYSLQLAGAFAVIRFSPERAGTVAALLDFAVSSLAGVALGAWQLRRQVRLRGTGWRSWARIWARAWEFGKWLTAQNAMIWIGSRGHAWLVGIMLGVEQVGLYRAATHLVNVLNPVRQAAYRYLPARGSVAYRAGDAVALERWVRRTGWVLLAAIAPLALLLVIFPQALLHLAYGARYASPRLALILALSVVAQCTTYGKFPFDLGLLALRESRSLFNVNLIPVLLLLTSGVTLVHFLGILGVPISALLINCVVLVATWRAYRHRLREATARQGEHDARVPAR